MEVVSKLRCELAMIYRDEYFIELQLPRARGDELPSLFAMPADEFRIAIVGSREYPNLEDVSAFVDILPPQSIVVSGGARGVDTAAVDRAKVRGLATEVHLPDYATWGRVIAPAIRNSDIVRDADILVAFQYRDSSGTADAILKAQRKGIPVKVYP